MRAHTTQIKMYDRIQADDLRQASIIMAAFVYNTAMPDSEATARTSANQMSR